MRQQRLVLYGVGSARSKLFYELPTENSRNEYLVLNANEANEFFTLAMNSALVNSHHR